MNRKVRYGLALAVVAIGLGFLIFQGTTKATAYYYTVDEYVDLVDRIGDRPAQIKGRVVPGSIHWDAARVLLEFELEENGAALPVVYHDVKPDVLQDDIEVVATGRLDENGRFQAQEILVKCPSKYEASGDGR